MPRNAEYVISITSARSPTWSHCKEGDHWTRTGPNGRVHRKTAEQLLSHLLPLLAGDQAGLSVRVERRSAVTAPRADIERVRGEQSVTHTSTGAGLDKG
jgi:hypothetical protein